MAATNDPVELLDEQARIQDPESITDVGTAALNELIYERQQTFQELLTTHDVVSVQDAPQGYDGMPYVVLAERTDRRRAESVEVLGPELGYAQPSPWTSWTREEWNPKLRDKLGLREYYKMKRQDGAIRGALRLLKTPILAGRWFIEPGSESEADVKIAEFVGKNLFEWLNVSWSSVLQDILLMCEYGFMPLEKVWKFNEKGQVVLQKLAPRHPLDIREWIYDLNGGPNGIVMEPTEMTGFENAIFIPIEKLAVFTMEAESGDMSGISVLRSAFKHYYYKDTLYKIDAIQKERHGIGVPIIKLPPNPSKEDKRLADELGRNLRTNDRAHVVLPMNWEIIFAKLEGQPVDCLKSIAHHNMQIMANILAPFMEDSSVDPKSTDMFLKSTRYIGLTITDVVNKHIIPQLVGFNFVLGADRCLPKLCVRRVGEQEDLRTMSFTFRNFVGADAIRPDDKLEAFIRKELDLPAADPTTTRMPMMQQEPGAAGDDNSPEPPAPGRTGLPRQGAKPQVNPGRSNTGNDRSGG